MIFIYIIRYFFFVYSLYRLIKNNTDENVNYVKQRADICGPLAIKLLQFIIMGRNDLLNTDKLNYVFEECNTHSLKETEDMYLKDFGNSIYDDYDFDENSMVIGSGSIGQVYKCYCKSKKKYIAIKVKHPDINKNVNKTVFALRIVCFILKPINIIHNICMEYINNIYLQIDYIQEVKNTEILKYKFRNENIVIIPEIYNYTNNFIIMSYHESKNYNQVSDHSQLLASMYINFIYLTGILVHDFLHADLHYGNWKIIEESGDKNLIKILIYDCGITCSTGDLDLNNYIMENISSGKTNFMNLLDIFKIVDPKLSKRIDSYRSDIYNFIESDINNDKVSSSDCFRKFLRRVLELRLLQNKNLINLLTSIAIIGETPKKSISVFVKYILYPTGTNSLLYHIYVDILSKMDHFTELKNFFIDYLKNNPINKKIYEDWLYQEFGHRKGYILSDIIYDLFFPKTLNNNVLTT